MKLAVTSQGTLSNSYSVKTVFIFDPLPPYFIVLANSVKALEVKAIEFHRIMSGVRRDSI